MTHPQRPEIEDIHTGDELRRWYWLKEELVAYCRQHSIPYSAGKFTLIDRIAHYLDTGDIPRTRRKRVTSTFDWAHEPLTLETVITDSYRNNDNVRAFMVQHLGTGFRFHMEFMAWMRDNTGKTLQDAVIAWREMAARRADDNYQTEIAHHNQYNQYVRDFFADNPALTMKEARCCWLYKRSLPRENGRHTYHRDDLIALEAEA
ncbi:MAG: DUF6434 domain-containing protein [Chloroflexota bacterium]